MQDLSSILNIAIAVLIEHGGGGGKHAVPVASRVVRDWLKLRDRRIADHEPARDAPEGEDGT